MLNTAQELRRQRALDGDLAGAVDLPAGAVVQPAGRRPARRARSAPALSRLEIERRVAEAGRPRPAQRRRQPGHEARSRCRRSGCREGGRRGAEHGRVGAQDGPMRLQRRPRSSRRSAATRRCAVPAWPEVAGRTRSDPARDRADVGLRLAQHAGKRQAQGARAQARERFRATRARIEAHADQATLQRPSATRGRAISSAWHSAADSRSKTERQTGMRMASALSRRGPGRIRAGRRACRARHGARRRGAAARAGDDGPADDGRVPAAPAAERGGATRLERRLLAIDVAEHHGGPRRRNRPPRWVASVLLPLPPLRLTTATTGMAGLRRVSRLEHLPGCTGGRSGLPTPAS